MKNIKNILQYSLITIIGAWFLYFVFKGSNWTELGEKLQQADYNWIGLGLIIAMLSHYLRGLRAVMVYETMGYKVPVRNSVMAVLVGYMMNYIIPRAGELSRCAALNKTDGMPVEKSLGTVVAERAFDLLILLLLLLFIFMVNFGMISAFLEQQVGDSQGQGESLPWWKNIKILALLLLGTTAVFLFLFRKKLLQHKLAQKLMHMLKGFSEGLLSIRHVKKPWLFVLYSVLIWLCYVLMMYFCLFSMQATSHISFSGCLTIFAIGTIGVVIPAPAAGAGTYHFAVMQSLKLYGVAEADGIAYATLVHGVQMILLLALGAIASLIILSSQKKKSV